jgi:hypothetical protein
MGTRHTTKGTKFSFFKSYYVDDTAFLLLSCEELETASKLIVSHFRRVGLTIHTGSRRKGEDSKTEAIHFPRPGRESSAADTEDIVIDEDHFMTFCTKFNITERLTQGRKLFGAMRKQLLCNKQIPIDIRRRVYQATVVNIALYGAVKAGY